jgi:hypothetical protein
LAFNPGEVAMSLQKTFLSFALLILASSAAQAGFALLGGVPAPDGKTCRR